MSRATHEIPTHLNVEDKLVFGLTARQSLSCLVGCSLSYGVWDQLALAPPALRVGLVGACLLATVLLVLLRPLGRPLEEWLVAAAFYLASPRRATWGPREPRLADWRPGDSSWQELLPNLAWVEEDAA
jgi:hypothetical protein